VDPSHADLRDAQGHSRIAWLLDLSRRPAGLHPELEAHYGCLGDAACAIYSGADLDVMLSGNGAAPLPTDATGHGTHVAALAASNGLGSPGDKYLGMAPEATLVVVRAARDTSGGVYDDDVLLGTRFVFEQAAAMGLPAVVNLSLGGDFGPHDGSGLLERALSSWVGPTAPGRAIVVAAGNGAELHTLADSRYPGQWGIHTEATVTTGEATRIPLLVPGTQGAAGQLYVWLEVAPGSDVSVALEGPKGTLIASTPRGQSASVTDGELRVQLFNGVGGDSSLGGNVAAVFSGAWQRSTTYALRLTGHAAVEVWLQSDGALAPGAGTTGGLVPLATKASTISIPATSPDLISVGALINREGWIDSAGSQEVPALPADDSRTAPGQLAWFSARGPNGGGAMKPDLLAPGGFVIGAMASTADPRSPLVTRSIFADPGCLSPGCRVVDDAHAVASGTSMAAPQVSGALALLLGRNPTLTQPDLLAILQASSRRTTTAEEVATATGALDLVAALEVSELEGRWAPSRPAPKLCWMVLADDLLRPGEGRGLQGRLLLRSRDGVVADPLDGAPPRLLVERGTVLSGPTRLAPGLWSFAIASAPDHPEGRVTVLAEVEGQVVARADARIAADRWATDGLSPASGCSTSPGGPSDSWGWRALALMFGFIWVFRRAPNPRGAKGDR